MSDYTFTTDWGSAFRENAEKLFLPLAGKPLSYLEIGIWEGRSACWMLDNVLTSEIGYAVCVDWKVQDIARRNLQRHMYMSFNWPKVVVREGNSRIVVPRETDDYDIIYIDGDHSARGVLADSVNCWRLCREGGIILWDDYEKTGKDNGVKKGVQAFLSCLPKNHYKVLVENFQFAVMKKVDWK